jgi:hypothetical protein
VTPAQARVIIPALIFTGASVVSGVAGVAVALLATLAGASAGLAWTVGAVAALGFCHRLTRAIRSLP